MRRPSMYHTKQGEAILSYIASLQGSHLTVEQIANYFEEQNQSIGMTTIYRNLDKFVSQGKIRKYVIDGISGACYQYQEDVSLCGEHFHLKCEVCGELFHLQCESLDELSSHVALEHTFRINPTKTVFYGICQRCQTALSVCP